MLILFRAMFFCWIDYGYQFWSPYKLSEIKELESIQWEFTKLINRLSEFLYCEDALASETQRPILCHLYLEDSWRSSSKLISTNRVYKVSKKVLLPNQACPSWSSWNLVSHRSIRQRSSRLFTYTVSQRYLKLSNKNIRETFRYISQNSDRQSLHPNDNNDLHVFKIDGVYDVWPTGTISLRINTRYYSSIFH